MRKIMFTLTAAFSLAVAPAHAEPSTSQPPPPRTAAPAPQPAPFAPGPSVEDVQTAVGESGAWMVEYSALLSDATAIMNEIDNYTAILDRFEAGQVRERQVLTQLRAWQESTTSRAQALRLRATTLRPPPSLAVLGEAGNRLQHALSVARADLPVLMDQMSAQLDALAALGIEAVENPGKASEVRRRAVFTSSTQLISIDLRRINATAAAIADDHPNRNLMNAVVSYYTALNAFPAHELRVLDGGAADPQSVVTTLRRSAQEMRAQLGLASTHADTMSREVRDLPAPPEAAQMRRTVLQMMATIPETVATYGRVAVTLDEAAAYIEGGGDIVDAWAQQEEAAIPLFDAIALQDTRRAELAATLR